MIAAGGGGGGGRGALARWWIIRSGGGPEMGGRPRAWAGRPRWVFLEPESPPPVRTCSSTRSFACRCRAARSGSDRSPMTETVHNLLLGFSVALSPPVLLYAFVGCVVGTIVGVLPGVGPLAGISLLLPATFGLDATKAIVMLAGIYYGAMYGGSTTSILMRIPGEAASVMTCIDGYAMARKGRGGAALAIAAVGSYIAGTVSVVRLMFLAPPLAA